MITNNVEFASTQFRTLSDDQIARIFHAALEVLEHTGSRVHEEESRALLAGAGALVDGDLVRLPAGVVQEALASVPPRIVVGNREGERTLVLEGNRISFGTGSDCPFILDDATGARRLFTKRDIEEAARVVDACPNLDFHMSLGLMSDVPTYSYDCHQAAAMLRNTRKPLVLTAMSRQGLSLMLEMYYLLRGGRETFEINPGFVVYLEPITPLTHGKAVLEKLLFAAERRIPAIYTPCPIAGATSPVTLAGTLVVALAEFLAGMTVSQLKRRGAPLILGGVLSSLDMHTMILTYGSPELHLLSAAMCDIAHWLRIPVFSTAGCSDSKCLDEQAALEAALSIMAAGLSGGNLIHDVGFLESALIGSHEMVVLSDEIIGMVKHFLAGVRIDDATLGLDVIHQAGPGGNFAATDHTAEHFRRELWFPRLIDRSRYEIWQGEGARTLGDRVRERVRDILDTHRVPPLSAEIEDGIDRILAEADRRVGAREVSLA